MIRNLPPSPLSLAAILMSVVFCPADSTDWEKARDFWSFKPPVQAAVPQAQRAGWARGDIDRFILSGMESAGLVPAGQADRRILARRVFYDLSGLPPTAEQADAFASDMRPDAFEQLVDRLLEAPTFGERLASIWLNIARYAEDQAHQVGNDKKFFYPHAHRYRQWVISAFNNDLSYDRFIRLHGIYSSVFP